MAKKWLSRLNKQNKRKKTFFTKKHFKTLSYKPNRKGFEKNLLDYTCDVIFSFNEKERHLVLEEYAKLHVEQKSANYRYLLRARHMFQRFMAKMPLNELKRMFVKSIFKKNRMYLYNFLIGAELRISSVLFHTHLLTSPNLIKHSLRLGKIMVNDTITKMSFNEITHPLDVLGADLSNKKLGEFLGESSVEEDLKKLRGNLFYSQQNELLGLNRLNKKYLRRKFFHMLRVRIVSLINELAYLNQLTIKANP